MEIQGILKNLREKSVNQYASGFSTATCLSVLRNAIE